METKNSSQKVVQAQASHCSDITLIRPDDIETTIRSHSIDLISKPLGSKILACSDEWFGSAQNLIVPDPPVRKPGLFTYTGAWYDGWETRRHNPEPFDWVVIRLGALNGRVKGVEIDTTFFDGNHAPEVAVQGCFTKNDEEPKNSEFKGWETILSKQECRPNCLQAWLLNIVTTKSYTHVRLLMYPDGGIARFRLYGVPALPEPIHQIIDLAAAVNGGIAISCSDQHFGNKNNLLLPTRGNNMGDGWETKRSRGNHVDWVVIKLGAIGEICKIVIDTRHFRGNYPQMVQVFALKTEKEPGDNEKWTEVLSPQKTGPDKEHEYNENDLKNVHGETYSHMKLVIIPDGGVKRFRVYGRRNLQ